MLCVIVVLCMVISVRAHRDMEHLSSHYWHKAKSLVKNAWCKITGHLPHVVRRLFPEFCHLQTGLTVPTGGGVNDLKARIMEYEDTILDQRCRLLVMDLKENKIVPWDKKTDKVLDIVKRWYKTFVIRFIDLQRDFDRSERKILRDLTKFIEEERVFEGLVFTLKDQGFISYKTESLDCIDVIEDWFDHYHRDNKYKE